MSYGNPEYDELMDAWKCELCGKFYRKLTTHMKAHGLSMQKYKEMFGFNRQFVLEGKEIIEKQRVSNKKLNKIKYIKGKEQRAKKGDTRNKDKVRRAQFYEEEHGKKKKDYSPVKIEV